VSINGNTEIVSGVSAGERVVTQDVFDLKSILAGGESGVEIHRLLDIALRYRVLVIPGTLFVAAMGVLSVSNLLVDVEPDIIPNELQILGTIG